MAPRALRVLRILPTLGAGGTERQCLEVVSHILENGLQTPAGRKLQIDIATIYGPASRHTLSIPNGIQATHLNLPRGTAGIVSAAPRLRKMLENYDCAHALLWPAVWAMARARPAVPWAASLHGSKIRTDPLKLKLKLDRAAFQRADRVVFNSQAGYDTLRRILAIPTDHALIITNGKQPYDGPELQREGLVCVARFLPPKRHDVLLDALELMPPRKRPLLRLYGMDTQNKRLETEIESRHLTSSASALGETDEPLKVMAEAELAVLPSDHEGTPNVVLEAWAAGTPVLASDVSGIRQLVKHGEDGWLVANTPAAWADAIGTLLSDTNLRARLVSNGLARLKREFSMDACALAWAKLYGELCGEA